MRYPVEVKYEEFSEELKELYKVIDLVQVSVNTNNLDELRKVPDKHDHKLRYYLDLDNESASKLALRLRNFKIYEELLAHGVTLAPHEDENEMFSNMSIVDQNESTKIHLKYKKTFRDNHIKVFLSRTSISFDGLEMEQYKKHVKSFYDYLSRDKDFNVMLRILAVARYFDIILDFNRNHISVMDPTSDS